MTKLLILFIVCNIANVMLQTFKSIVTIKCGPTIAAAVNAIAYGFYTYIIIITNCELPTWQKMLVVAMCNLIGVYVVKYIEDRVRKDRLWKVEATVPRHEANSVLVEAKEQNLSFNYIAVGRHVIFNFYCDTKEDSALVKKLLNAHFAKYFVSESKLL